MLYAMGQKVTWQNVITHLGVLIIVVQVSISMCTLFYTLYIIHTVYSIHCIFYIQCILYTLYILHTLYSIYTVYQLALLKLNFNLFISQV